MQMSAAVAAAATSSRSGYISYLRRAFLLRAHPDRYRKHSQDVVKGQAAIVQALAERLAAPDFGDYIANKSAASASSNLQHQIQQWKPQKYYLERKNGQLVQHVLPLNDTAEAILASLSKALKSTGLIITTKPPPAPSPPSLDDLLDDKIKKTGMKNYHNEELSRVHNSSFWAAATAAAQGSGASAMNDVTLNETFDINTTRGRNFVHFVTNLDTKEIEQRKAERIDASAAALVARQAYKFQSIDGTKLGWSSSSLAKSLKTLTKVYDEHYEKFKVESFYPFQLILSNDEFQNKLDLYGGKIMLNPGSTQIQWLETLMAVTDEKIQFLEKNRKELHDNTLAVQNALNVKLRKGFSCTSEEYYSLMKEFAMLLTHQHNDRDELNDGPKTTALALDRVGIVVETHQACRRPVVTSTGEIRISASMSPNMISSSIGKLRNEAFQNLSQEKEKQRQAKELVSMLKYEFGLIKVSKTRLSTVTSDQYLQSLANLLRINQETKQQIKESLTGNSLNIASRGVGCHLGDDGTIQIPYDYIV
mmetsp:Transcript_25386/g.37961  ORF Transcript_25386/g.37961 Transcript_25386/m.37961 type:complete len:534 (-) Transcript_25386:793-2394(-)|eukprot:CAMPEP_0203663422 /NCGR_PEP_ID=MMETSP0090-20130426/1020_1 /ASSEMBLY_ACC=CAM_ASM_001088 /TAXON_ID=426623 /ORGANISM="Chaetoceros affinis, Strain CCMP159" /LENGTH=533 /DNA_ID=CAMNT_0050526333 /DNA_START=12 /DNA_END=1613 /DNA_ORIENTATION=-